MRSFIRRKRQSYFFQLKNKNKSLVRFTLSKSTNLIILVVGRLMHTFFLIRKTLPNSKPNECNYSKKYRINERSISSLMLHLPKFSAKKKKKLLFWANNSCFF